MDLDKGVRGTKYINTGQIIINIILDNIAVLKEVWNMVRADYKYVDEASAICLTTTESGHNWLGAVSDEQIGVNPIVDLLLLVEQEYVQVNAGVDDWLSAVNKAELEYGSKPVVTRKTIIEALEKGYLGVHKVIWD